MQFKIPQNINIEEQILPFLTLKQLFILLGGGAIDYIIYVLSATRYDPSIYIIPVIFVFIITLLIAFFKIENITFLKLVLLTFETMVNPRTRYWYHGQESLPALDKMEALLQIQNNTGHPTHENTQGNVTSIEQLTKLVDTSSSFVEESVSYQDTK